MTNLKIIKLQYKTLSESEQEDFINWINKKKAKKNKKVKKEKKKEVLKFKHFIKPDNGKGWDKSPQEIQEEHIELEDNDRSCTLLTKEELISKIKEEIYKEKKKTRGTTK